MREELCKEFYEISQAKDKTKSEIQELLIAFDKVITYFEHKDKINNG